MQTYRTATVATSRCSASTRRHVDTSSGALRAIETVPVDGTVMPMALSPDHHRLYAALRSTPYRVVGFAINPPGRARRQRLAARPTRHPQAPQPVR
jgi:6-phosphogluconolactonase